MSDFKTRLQAAAAAMKEQGVDQNKIVQGGGDGPLPPPAAGLVRLRLISYVEFGTHTSLFKGEKKKKKKIALTFELSGPKHAPRETDNGPVPQRITVYENLSQHEKARWPKLFKALNYKGTATHVVELIGEAFLGTIIHREYTRKDGTKGTAADLFNKDAGSYTIRAPRTQSEDPDTGEVVFTPVKVAEPISPLKLFLWDAPTIEDWDSLFIDGTYDEVKNDAGVVTKPAKSKNVVQAEVLRADNFKGSLLEALLVNNGKAIDLPDAERVGEDEDEVTAPEVKAAAKSAVTSTPEGAAATDALNGIV